MLLCELRSPSATSSFIGSQSSVGGEARAVPVAGEGAATGWAWGAPLDGLDALYDDRLELGVGVGREGDGARHRAARREPRQEAIREVEGVGDSDEYEAGALGGGELEGCAGTPWRWSLALDLGLESRPGGG